MSLVAYDSSSDEEDNVDDDNQDKSLSKLSSSTNNSKRNSTNQINELYSNGHISDEEDENFNSNYTVTHNTPDKIERKGLLLPFPKNTSDGNVKTEESTGIPIHLKLPTPKMLSETNSSFDIVEEDDEFLHKKEIVPHIEKPPPPKKQPVKITIPSLNQFMDFKVENKKEDITSATKKSASLLAMLPDPQNENVFNSKNTENSKRSVTTTVTSLIPDHVKNRNKLKSVKDSPIINKQNITKSSTTKFLASDSEESDEDENKDFFSLNTKSKLPEVSDSEIKAMVEKKVVQMTKVSKKIDEMVKPDKNQIESDLQVEIENNTSVDQLALQALVGASQAKRKKYVEAQFVEISSEQVLPNRDEWMRASLTAETSYQPRGLLVDEEPAPGTRKKHQITYLAHQAKANEAELQAMWAANRQNRRAAASKYGF